jgi:MinD-like ATPase involved in chromosome partitioning or flagellar assembly
MSADLKKVMTQSRIVIVCGTGGVGKTTVSAALALKGALDGLNSVVVTIDPARRLAHTLGLDNLPNQPQAIDEALWKVNDRKDGDAAPSGTFSALQLDAAASQPTLPRPSASSTIRSTATSLALLAEPRNTWQWKSSMNLSRVIGST